MRVGRHRRLRRDRRARRRLVGGGIGRRVVVDRPFAVDRLDGSVVDRVLRVAGVGVIGSSSSTSTVSSSSASYRSASGVGGSPQRSTPEPGRCRIANTTIANAITIADTTIAVGTPKNVQLPARSVSSSSRTTAYQTRNRRNRSPGRRRAPHRRAIHSSVIAPMTPLSDSYRNNGWKNVVSTGYKVHGYWMTRWSQSIAMPHGSVVGGP